MSYPDRTAAERQRRWYANHTAEKTALTRARYVGHKLAGLCVVCGRAQAARGIVRCEGCAAKMKLRRWLS